VLDLKLRKENLSNLWISLGPDRHHYFPKGQPIDGFTQRQLNALPAG